MSHSRRIEVHPLTGRIGADFIPNRYVVESVTRKDGSTRGPLNWNTMEQ